jgi:hypothetical protein
LDTMKRSVRTDESSVFVPKRNRGKEKRKRLDLPTSIRNTKLSFEIGLNCLDHRDDWDLKDAKEVIRSASMKFIDAFCKDVGSLTDSRVEAYEKGCKDRAKILGKVMHKLQTSEPGDIMVYVYNGSNVVEIPRLRYLKKGAELLLIKEGDEYDVILEFEKEPKIYGLLYKAMIRVLDKYYLPIKVSQPEKALLVLQMAQFLITTGNIYTALRSTEGMINEREKESFEQLRESSKQLPDFLVEEFEELARDIKENKLPYVREWNQAVRSVVTKDSLKFKESDYYSSIKSSASYSKRYGRLPASLASAYEVDVVKEYSHEFDEMTGYESHYLEEIQDARTLVGKTLSIDQNKIKRRIIHIFSNAVQDRMSLIERLLSGVTRRLPSDCTKNQRLGVQAAMLWTSRDYREERDNPTVACMDLSNATDDLNPDFQRMVLGLILPEPMVDWWMRVISLDKEFQFYGFTPKLYKQLKGQPQGLLSSFLAFALAHHILMLLVMRRAGMEGSLASQAYRILGDDSIINSIEGGIGGESIVKHYIQLASAVNWTVDISKSNITMFEDDYAFAEFAKVTVLDGVIVTPPPFRLLSQIAGMKDRGAREFAFCIWLAKHGYAGEKVLDACMDRWAEGERRVILNTLVKGGIVPFLSEFKDASISDESDMWKNTAIEYLRSVIKESIVDSVLNDREMASLDYMETYIKKIKVKYGEAAGLSEIELLDELTINLPIDHKLFYFLQRNASIEDAVKSITGLDSSKTVLSSLQLTEEEIDAIISIDSILQLRNGGILDINRSSLEQILVKLGNLDRYRLKSVYKSIGRMSNSLLEVVDSYSAQATPSVN